MDDTEVKVLEKINVTEVVISGAMTIQRIEVLRKGLLEAFDYGKTVQVSLAGVTSVDISGLQLLCSAHRTSIVRGVAFAVAGGESAALSAVAVKAGMVRHVGCANDICGTCVWKGRTVSPMVAV